MTQIDNKFKVKKGLEVVGETLLGNTTVTGDLIIPTQPSTDNSTKAASTAFVKAAVADILDAAPGTLDTLNELAAALGDDPNFAATVSTNLALKAPLANPALTGVPTAPTAATATNTTQLATTAFVKAQLASTALTGVPTAPTAAADTSTTQLATTAFVMGQAAQVAPLMNSVALVGTSLKYARQDHVHASDTTKASLSGAAFTGAVSVANDITQTGAFAIQNSTEHLYLQSVAVSKDIIFRTLSTTERMRIKSGTGAVLVNTTVDNGVDQLQVAGTVAATTFKGGAALTGTPTAPTAAPGTNTTQLATTAFVVAGDALKANAANPSFTGDAVFAGAIASNDYISIPLPDGARYTTTTAVITGAFKITLPVLYTDSMVDFTVRFHEHATGETFELVVGGFLNMSSATWQSVTAFVSGEAVGKIPNIRFGNDGSRSCIWVGDAATAWDFPQVTVRDVSVGFVGLSSSWLNSWAIAPVTTFDTIKVGPIVPTKFAGVASPALTGVPTAPTATAGNNSTQIATTAYVDAADALKAPLASPALTGTPTAPTATPGTSTTQVATTAFVGTAVANLIAASPAALDTLNELAAALGNDPAFATTITNSVSLKAPLASPALTGVPVAPTAAVDTSTTQLATTAFVINQGYAKIAGNGYAPLANPVFTGDPKAPTPATSDNDTSIATTAFVRAAASAALTKSVAGGVTVNLTAAEVIYPIIILTGVLTANIQVIFPTATGMWTVINNTTGPYTITFKLATGTSVSIVQGYSADIVSDGSNIIFAQSDYANVFLGGVPTATTAATADNTTRVATTAFVKAQSYIATTDTIDGGSY